MKKEYLIYKLSEEMKEATRKIPYLQDLHTELGLHWNYSVGAWLPISIRI